MEFGEKLQALRKSLGLTQEELAEALYVSRTAISKWESNRGYPSIDSLKEISSYFSVSIDDLLSGEKLLSIAENENKSNLKNMCDLLFSIVDVFSFLLIVLPLYPKTIDGYVYSVNLLTYSETSLFNRWSYWILFLVLILIGIIKIILVQTKTKQGLKIVTKSSMIVSSVAVLFLALAGETYAVAIVFLLLLLKGILLFKVNKNS